MNTNKTVFVYRCCKDKKTTDISNSTFWKIESDVFTIEFEKANDENMPKCIQTAYKKKQEQFVIEYLGLKSVFDHGGIFITDEIEFLQNAKELFTPHCFFVFDNDYKISNKIFGASKGCSILKEILDTYNDNNEYYKDQLNIPLAERIFDVLRFNYALPNICHTFKHKDILNIYSPYEILYNLYKWNMVRIANCTLTEEDFKLFENEFVPYKNQIQDKQNEINWLYGRIHELENSTSFKITKPLRKLGSFVRKVFRKLKKIAKKILRGG